MIALLLIVSLSASTEVDSLVLISGEKIGISELVAVENDVVLYRDQAGVLYSIRLDEVDLTATTDPELEEERESRSDVAVISPGEGISIPTRGLTEEESARILAEFYESVGEGSVPDLDSVPRSGIANAEGADGSEQDESYWRNESLSRREAIRRTKEDLARAREREQVLNDQLLFLAGSTGDASPYSYIVEDLEQTRARIPMLEEALLATEREYREFEDEARRRGILPGWLR